ncbi:rod shape-determining protein MreC [Pseudostreptobacillus hongkongensis]|uniref:rod shape-determining protein MreC n=1 Tax=Pseudostreptobacillus hongkongensis TaxID=1162717 RepID=UPI0028D0BADE|nr:rod shape-determining protein MreC [Pseudostreptobacillus hongkongensis]
MKNHRRKIVRRLVLGVFLFIVIILFRASISNFTFSALSNINFNIVKTRSNIYSITKEYQDKLGQVRNLDTQVEENKKLKQELEILKSKNSEYENLKKENSELRASLNLKNESNSEYIVSDVILISSFFDDGVIYIDKGSKDGIETNLPVFSNGNIIGKINEVNTDYSEVHLLSNSNFRMSVEVNSFIKGILRGKGNSEFVINNFNVEDAEKIRVFDIKTSGVSELYPKGLNLGKYTMLNSINLIENKELILKMNIDVSKLDTVVVYKYDRSKLKLIEKINEERSD